MFGVLPIGFSASSGIVVATDGPDGVFVPATADEFAALTLTAPNSLFLCDEASGNLADSIGAVVGTAGVTPTYQNTVTDWTRKFLGFNEESTERFSIIDGTYNPSTTSQAQLIYAKVETVSVASRRLMSFSATALVRFTTGGLVQLVNGANLTAGVYDYRDGDVHPFLLKFDRTGTLTSLWTDKEELTVTWTTSADAATKGIGGGTGTPPASKVGYWAWWSGSPAEAVGKATLTALGWSLAY